jgi:hypothetical protein
MSEIEGGRDGHSLASMMPSLAEILDKHVTLEIESIDRLYLNGYVPGLQTPEAVAYFLRKQRGAKFASSVLLDEISRDFDRRITQFVRRERCGGWRVFPSPRASCIWAPRKRSS